MLDLISHYLYILLGAGLLYCYFHYYLKPEWLSKRVDYGVRIAYEMIMKELDECTENDLADLKDKIVYLDTFCSVSGLETDYYEPFITSLWFKLDDRKVFLTQVTEVA